MKSIFLCENAANPLSVYSKETRGILKDTVGLEETVYNKVMIAEAPAKFADTEYIFSTWGMPVFSEQEIKKLLPSLKVVFYAAGTVQYFARPFLNCGVKVFSAWAANAVPVAEYTVAQIILANKGFYKTSYLASNGKYLEAKKVFSLQCGNYGAKVGIIGAGMIGKLVIKMLKAYNLKVLVFDPFLSDEKAVELGVEKTTLECVFSECNVVSNHLADNEATRGMLNGKLFSKMPKNSTFINTGRGAQVVESDLIDVLKQREDIIALLDVTLPEPPKDDSELYNLENCILTPHIAGSAGDEVHRMGKYMAEEFRAYSNNEPCKYEVTLQMLETMA